jgi:hypothetical protein
LADRTLEETAHRRIAGHFRLLAERLAAIGVPLHELQVRRPWEEAFLAMLAGAVPLAPAMPSPARA